MMKKMMPPIYFVATFWGELFQQMLCRYALSSLMAPGNIPALVAPAQARLLLATPQEDWDRIQRDPWFQALNRAITCEWLQNEEAYPGEHKYRRMSRGHAMLAERCFRDGAIAVNINPDSIYHADSIAEVQRLWESGARLIQCVAVRFDQDGIESELKQRNAIVPGQPLVLSNSEAVDIGLRNLHSETQASRWGAANFGQLHPQHGVQGFLTACYWQTKNDDGLVIVTHNWAPFMVDYSAISSHDASALDGRALDGNYIWSNFRNGILGKDIHVVTDSSSLFGLGMTPADEMIPQPCDFWWFKVPLVRHFVHGWILNTTVFHPDIEPLRRRIYREKLVVWHRNGHAEAIQAALADAQRILGSFAAVDFNPWRAVRENSSLHVFRSLAPRPEAWICLAVYGLAKICNTVNIKQKVNSVLSRLLRLGRIILGRS